MKNNKLICCYRNLKYFDFDKRGICSPLPSLIDSNYFWYGTSHLPGNFYECVRDWRDCFDILSPLPIIFCFCCHCVRGSCFKFKILLRTHTSQSPKLNNLQGCSLESLIIWFFNSNFFYANVTTSRYFLLTPSDKSRRGAQAVLIFTRKTKMCMLIGTWRHIYARLTLPISIDIGWWRLW